MARAVPPVLTVAADPNEVWPRAGRVPPRRKTSRHTRRTLGQPFLIPSVRVDYRPRSRSNAVWPCASGLPSGSRRISYRSDRGPPSVVSLGRSGSRSRERLIYLCPTIVQVVGDCRTSEDGDTTKLPRLSNATSGCCSRSDPPPVGSLHVSLQGRGSCEMNSQFEPSSSRRFRSEAQIQKLR
jgi:hypothetical protein